MLAKLKEKVKKLKLEIVPVYYALFDRRTPLIAKILAGITIGYFLSPIDLIPDFIPVLGLVDDIIIVPLLISATIKLIPKAIIEDIKKNKDIEKTLRKSWLFALPILLVYSYLLYSMIIYFKNFRATGL